MADYCETVQLPRVTVEAPAIKPAGDSVDRSSLAGSADRVGALLLLFLAVPQIYLLPGGLIDVSLSTAITLVLLPVIFVHRRVTGTGRLVRSALFLVLIGLLLVRLAALAWSPDPRSGLQPIFLLGQFVLTVVLMWRVMAKDAEFLRMLQRFYWPWVVLEICLVVLFRFLPGVEEAFLHHVGGFFIGHNSVASYFGESPNNVTDVAKAGGVFLNANVAAIFLGVNGLAALAIAAVTGVRGIRYVGIAALLAVPFTGSKSATILAAVLPALAFVAIRATHVAKQLLRRWLAVAGGLALAAVIALTTVDVGFIGAVKEAFVGRTIIWGFGAEAFADNPILGLGYGGWEIGFHEYALAQDLDRADFPPHNLFLAAWAKTGILGLILTGVFFALVVRLIGQGFSSRSGLDRRFVALAGAAFGWVIIQGMGENTDLFGEIHLIPILSLLIGCLSQRIGEETSYRGKHIGRRGRQTPAIPAVRDVYSESSAVTAVLPAIVRGQGPGSGQAGDGIG
jgi:hypothetical protein